MATLVQNVQSIYNNYAAIKTAIEDKNVTVASGTPVTDYPTLIGQISGGSGTDMMSQTTDWYRLFYGDHRADWLNAQTDIGGSHVTSFQEFASTSGTKLTIIPAVDTSNATNVASMFSQCYNVNSVLQSDWHFEKVTSGSNLSAVFNFVGRGKTITTPLNIYLASGTLSGATSLFQGSGFTEINIKTETVFSGSVSNMFGSTSYDTAVVTITGVNFSGASGYSGTFARAVNLVDLTFADGSYLGKGGTSTSAPNFSACTNLSDESLMNILECANRNPNTTTNARLVLGTDNLDRVNNMTGGAELIEELTNKKWTVA